MKGSGCLGVGALVLGVASATIAPAQDRRSGASLTKLVAAFHAAKSVDRQKDLLTRIAATDPDRTSRDVAESLQFGLVDDDLVAAHALELLTGRSPVVLLPTLLDEVDRVRARAAAIETETKRILESLGRHAERADVSNPGALLDTTLRQLSATQKANRELEALAARLGRVDGRRAALARALGAIPDDRSVDALARLLEGTRVVSLGGVVGPLLELGSKNAWQAWLTLVRRLDDERRATDRETRKLARAKPRPVPDGMNPKAWRQAERRRLKAAAAQRRASAKTREERVQGLVDLARLLGENQGLKAIPRRADPGSWRLWLSRQRTMPPTLGRIDAGKR